MQQIRKKVFETNSSSSHSLTVSHGDLVALPLAPEILRAGEVTVSKGEFGWEWYRYYTVLKKIEYLVTQLFQDDVPFGTREEVTALLREQSEAFDRLCRVFEEFTGVKLYVTPGSSGYIDHDSVGVGMLELNSDEELRALLFGADSYIETGNDNRSPSRCIPTDRGDEQYYHRFYREAQKDWVTMLLTSESRWDVSLRTPCGVELTSEENAALFQELKEQATVSALRIDSKEFMEPFAHQDPHGAVMTRLSAAGFFFTQELSVDVRYREEKDYQKATRLTTYVFQMPASLAEAVQALKQTS